MAYEHQQVDARQQKSNAVARSFPITWDPRGGRMPPYAITRSLRPGNGLFIKILQVLESRILGLLSDSLIKARAPAVGHAPF